MILSSDPQALSGLSRTGEASHTEQAVGGGENGWLEAGVWMTHARNQYQHNVIIIHTNTNRRMDSTNILQF